jgi:hypothetical protein
MRLILAFCLSVMMITFPGCKKAIAPPAVTGFKCGFSATYREIEVEGTLFRNGAGTLEMCISKPETLSGMKFCWDGQQGTVSLGDLRYSFDMELPQKAAPQLVMQVLDGVFRQTASKELTEYGTLCQGEVNGYSFSLLSDRQSGALFSLEVPDAALYIEFKDFQKTT